MSRLRVIKAWRTGEPEEEAQELGVSYADPVDLTEGLAAQRAAEEWVEQDCAGCRASSLPGEAGAEVSVRIGEGPELRFLVHLVVSHSFHAEKTGEGT